MHTLFENSVEVHWKCESEDVIYLLRENYKKEYPFILETVFDDWQKIIQQKIFLMQLDKN